MKHVLKHAILRFAALATALWLTLSCAAAATADEMTYRKVRVGCGFSDLLYLTEEGFVSGYLAEYLQTMAYLVHWEIEYVPIRWEEAEQKLLQGEIDLLPAIDGAQQRRENLALSTMASCYVTYGLFVPEDSQMMYTDAGVLNGARVAVMENSEDARNLEMYTQRNGLDCEIVSITSREEAEGMLHAGEVDLAFFGAMNSLKGCRLIHLFKANPVYFATSRQNDKLMSELNYGMRQMMANEPDIVGNMYAGALRGDQAAMPVLTDAEREFIASDQEIRIGFYEKTEPMAYVDKDGVYQGICIRALDVIRDATGVNMTFRVIRRNESWQELLLSGEIDFYMRSFQSISSEDERFVSTLPFVEYDMNLVTRDDFEIDDEAVFRLALPEARTHWVNKYIDHENVHVVYYETAKDCMVAVAAGQTDGTLMSNIEFTYESHNERFAHLIQWKNYRFNSGTVLTTLRNGNRMKLSVVSKLLRSVPGDEIEAVVNAGMNMSYIPTDVMDYFYRFRQSIGVGLLTLLVLCVLLMMYLFQRRYEKQHIRLERERMQIMEALSLEFSAVFYGDLQQDTYTVLRNNSLNKENVDALLRSSLRFSQAFEQYISRIVAPKDQAMMRWETRGQALCNRLRREGNFILRYHVVPNPAGQESFVVQFVDISPERNGSRVVVGFRCIDATVRAELHRQQELENAYKALTQANSAKSDFLSRMSHDIRTPMNAIIGMNTLAMAHLDDRARVENSLRKMDRASRYLLDLINEVLDMSKIESGKVVLMDEIVKLRELTEDVLELLKPQIRSHNHSLYVHLVDVVHEVVRGDRLRLQKIIVNILSNAIKYTPDGGRIVVTVQEGEEIAPGVRSFLFRCEDNGVGMTKEFIKQIFEPFSRMEDVRTAKVQGTGLGMSIVHSLVQMMNGSIEVESEPGKGSCFTITLAMRVEQAVQIPDEIRGMRVLVVDDDVHVQAEIARQLAQAGAEGDSALSGAEGIEKLRQARESDTPYDAVLLDYRMPDMDGVQTAGKMAPHLDERTELILSVYECSGVMQAANAVGITRFLARPVFRSVLYEALATLHNEQRTSLAAAGADGDGQSKFKGRRVLLVEDNELNQEIELEILQMAELEVDVAQDGRVAVERFAASEIGGYDLIFMDVQMPVMNGYEATRAIRAMDRPDARTVPIVALSANAFTEDRDAAHEAGIDHYLSKPIDIRELKKTLEKFL